MDFLKAVDCGRGGLQAPKTPVEWMYSGEAARSGSWAPAAAMATVSGLAGKAAEAKRVSSLVRATP
jgi:hypothetical protein